MSTTTVATGPSLPRRRMFAPDWERLRFAACMTIYGATIGGCAILVNFLSRTQFPDVPEHMSLQASLFFASAGALAGAVMTAPVAYWLYGGLPTFAFTPRPRRGPRSAMAWALFGFGYGLLLPLLLGILLPVWLRFFAFYGGAISMMTLLSSLIDLTIGSIYLAPLFGFQYFFTSIVAGALFAAGALAIDTFNSSKDRATAKYGSWSMAVGLSVLVVILLVVVPETSLARLGRLG